MDYSKYTICPFSVAYNGKTKHFLWLLDEEEGEAPFVVDEITHKLIEASSTKELREVAAAKDLKVDWEDLGVNDIDKMFVSLRYLRIGRASYSNTCNLLLDSWNLIDDFYKAFGMISELNNSRIEQANYIYGKLLYGCNLPSLTPEGKEYCPLWSQEEIHLMRTLLRNGWRTIADKLSW
jgi:hypothetical protein